MERQKAVIASALLAGSLMTGGVAFAITGGALDGQQDNVGKLQPTTAVATVPDASTTVGQLPQTTSATRAPAITAAPPSASPSTTSQASPAAGGEYEDEHDDHDDGHEYDEHESEDDDD
jgi:hypothetical protein